MSLYRSGLSRTGRTMKKIDSTKYRCCDILNMVFLYKNEDCDAEAIDKGFFNYRRGFHFKLLKNIYGVWIV